MEEYDELWIHDVRIVLFFDKSVVQVPGMKEKP